MESFTISEFCERYGPAEIEETDFGKALKILPDLYAEGPWLAGGAVRRFVSNKPQDSDFDLFFASEGQMEEVKQKLLDAGAKVKNTNDFNTTLLHKKLLIQLIHIQYYESLEDTLNNFDFSLCKFGYDGTEIVVGKWSMWDLANKRLVPEDISYATSTLRRIIKYTRQGFTICSGGLAHILTQVVQNPEIIQQEIEYID
ncbi:MAG: hypothetical protein NXI13_13900 [Proteobacteria bacterium]|nr:hypothetical protein [Pseudomonadota bacterium]